MKYKFKKSDEITHGLGSAVIVLKDQHVCLDDPINKRLIIVEDPVIMVDLFTVSELKRYVDLAELSHKMRIDVEETVVRDKVVEVIGYPGKFINLYESPAGIVTTLANTIFQKSYDYIKYPKPMYGIHLDKVNFIEQMCAIVSYYLNMPFNDVEKLPVNEIFRLHTICHSAFPVQVNNIMNDVEELQ